MSICEQVHLKEHSLDARIIEILNHYPADVQEDMQALLRHSIVKVTESGCWEWQGARGGGGYGRIYRGRKSLYVHREMAKLAWGCVPEGHVVRHVQHNPACVNPHHLRLGTQKDNAADRSRANRSYHVLSERQVVEIIGLLHWTQLSLRDIAKAYGVAHSSISAIKKGITRPYLTRPW